MNLSLVWSKHIKDPKKRKEFESTILASITMRDRLLEILQEEERQLDSTSSSIKEFENPSWAYKQAFILGEKSRIKKLRDLLEPKDKI